MQHKSRYDFVMLFQVSQLEGVYSVQEPHFWTLCSDVSIGAIKVEVAMDADDKYILSQTHNIFTAVSNHTQLVSSVHHWFVLGLFHFQTRTRGGPELFWGGPYYHNSILLPPPPTCTF